MLTATAPAKPRLQASNSVRACAKKWFPIDPPIAFTVSNAFSIFSASAERQSSYALSAAALYDFEETGQTCPRAGLDIAAACAFAKAVSVSAYACLRFW